MIKGIYNENEFYNNFYWDNKFQDELKNKASSISIFTDATAKLKELDQLFWAMQDASKVGIKSQEALTAFYQEVFKTLGYKTVEGKRDTQNGKQYTLFLDEDLKGSPELFGALVDEIETGLFESQAIALNPTEEIPAEDRELSELLQEELLESERPPKWFLVGSHNALFIIERNKWSFGRFIKIEWQEIFLQRDIKPYEAIWGLASKAMLCPETGSSAHEEFDDNSHRHAFEVTTELRESVRESIELLINEMIYARKEARQGYLNKEEVAAIYAKELSHDALFYVYRLIFLLYLEAQGDDSDLLPLKSEIYRMGYSLEKLLELDFVTIMPNTPDYDGTFLQESLDKIFSLIYNGFNPTIKEDLFRQTFSGTGFLVKGIKSDLFNPDITKHLKGIKLRNGVLQQVLIRLSLTRVQARGRAPRSRVSYANLGINQLGAVYEGLLSYSGFFAQEELHALKPTSVKQSDIDNGKELDQVYLAPKSLVEKYRTTKEKKYKLTDDNVVLDESGNSKIYKKGSFIYRLAGRDRQKLASFYTPESLTKCTVKYSLKVLFENKKTLKDLWDVKILEPAMGSGAFLNEAVNQIADRILELEVKENVGDLKTPKDKQKRLWDIKYQLISNNVYGVDLNPTAIELARFSLWLNCIGAGKEPPQFNGKLKVGNSLIGARFKKGADGIYPWLLLDDGMMNYGKRLKDYDVDQYEKLQTFRKELLYSKLESSNDKIKALQLKAESILKELITNQDASKKQAAYERLKLCGDLWCSAFFLTGDDLKNYPAKHEALCDVFASIFDNGSLDPKLKSIVEEKYNSERFFHWEIEFPEIIAEGGFDLILGNPPWVAVEWEEALYISDFNPIPSLMGLSASEVRDFVEEEFSEEEKTGVLLLYCRVTGYIRTLENTFYSILKGISKNTYKHFSVLSHFLLGTEGVLGLIHEDGIYEEGSSDDLRRFLYSRMRYHFTFFNQKKLFEIGNARSYSLNIFSGSQNKDIHIEHIGTLFLPSTIDQCYSDSGLDRIPFIKDSNENWNTAGHKDRIIVLNNDLLLGWAKLNSSSSQHPPLPNIYSNDLKNVVSKIAYNSIPIKDFLEGSEFLGGGLIDETSGTSEKLISKTNIRQDSFDSVVFSGPNLGANALFWQQTKSEYENHRSYEKIDRTEISPSFIPRTLYSILNDEKLEASIESYKIANKPYRKFFRLAIRRRLDPVSQRCFYSALIPPGPIHINLIESLGTSDESKTIIVAAYFSSIVYEGIARLKNLKDCYINDILAMPVGNSSVLRELLLSRSLLLSYAGEKFKALLENNRKHFKSDDPYSSEISKLEKTALKDGFIKDEDVRQKLQAQIDVLVAASFKLSVSELLSIYEYLLPVMLQTDSRAQFDRRKYIHESAQLFQGMGI